MLKSLFRRRWKAPGPLNSLPFKSNEDAFEYACKFLICDIIPGRALPALVQDASLIFRDLQPITKAENTIQTVALRVASKDGGFLALARTAGRGPDLMVGDLVAWLPGKYVVEIAQQVPDQRFGWVGLIVGTLSPEWTSRGWKGKAKFTK